MLQQIISQALEHQLELVLSWAAAGKAGCKSISLNQFHPLLGQNVGKKLRELPSTHTNKQKELWIIQSFLFHAGSLVIYTFSWRCKDAHCLIQTETFGFIFICSSVNRYKTDFIHLCFGLRPIAKCFFFFFLLDYAPRTALITKVERIDLGI